MRKKSATLICLLLTFFFSTIFSPAIAQNISFGNGNNKAVIIGVGDYSDNRFDLQFPAVDAKDMYEFFSKSFTKENLLLLTDQEANTGNYYTLVSDFLDSNKFKSGDVLLIYFSGHGDAIDENNSFLLLHDLVASNDKNNYHASGTIAISNLKEKILSITKKGAVVYLIIDACRSNELPGGANGKKIVTNSIMESKNGERMMFAASPNQESVEGEDFGGGHGLFTYSLLRVLNGEGDTNKDSILTFKEISRATSAIVEEEIVKYNRLQDPYFCCNEFFYEPVIIQYEKNIETKSTLAELRTGKVDFRSTLSIEEKLVDTSFQMKYQKIKNLIRTIHDDIDLWEADKENDFENHIELASLYFNEIKIDSSNSIYKNNSFQSLSGLFLFLAQDKINRYLSNKDINTFQDELFTFQEASDFSKMIIPYLSEKDKKEVIFRQQFLYSRALIENNELDSSDKARLILDQLIKQKPDAAFLYHTKSLSYVAYDGESIENEEEFLANSNSAMHHAPNWSYPYNLRGKYCYFKAKTHYNNKSYYDSTFHYYQKAMENDSLFQGSYVNFAEVLMDKKTNLTEIEKMNFLKTLAIKKQMSYDDNMDLFYMVAFRKEEEKNKISDSISKIFLKNAILTQISLESPIRAFKGIQILSEKTSFGKDELEFLNSLIKTDDPDNSFLYYSIYIGMKENNMNRADYKSYKKKAMDLNNNIKKEYKKIKEYNENQSRLRKIRVRF